jgi:hypothetical protein
MDEFSPKIRALIDRTRADDDPSGQDRERVRHKLALAAAPLVGTVSASLVAKSAAAATGVKAAGFGVAALAKWTTGVALVVAVGAGAYQTMELSKNRSPGSGRSDGAEISEAVAPRKPAAEREGSRTAEEVNPGPSPDALSKGVGPENVAIAGVNRGASGQGSPSPMAVQSAGEKRRSDAAPSVGAGSTGSARSEVDLLALAQSKLTRGQAAEALQLVDAHRREFPKSALGAERIAVQVLALCQLGRTGEAERGLSEFERIAPSSPLQPRLLASCAGAERRAHDSNTIPPLTGN